MSIAGQFVALTVSAKAEASHLLQGSHNLHHYFPMATSPNHHYKACPDDTKHVGQTF